MCPITLGLLKQDALELEKGLKISYHEAFKLAVEIWKGESLEQIAYFIGDEDEFKKSLSNISNAIKKL